MVRYSFPVGLFHSLLHAGLIPAHVHNSHTRNTPGQGAIVQSSIANLETRPNSRVLCVTSVNPKLRACAAMNRSLPPIIVPKFFKCARICAYCEDALSGNSRTST